MTIDPVVVYNKDDQHCAAHSARERDREERCGENFLMYVAMFGVRHTTCISKYEQRTKKQRLPLDAVVRSARP